MSVPARILLLSGSLRGASSNSALLRTVPALAPEGFHASLYAGMGELPHFNPDDDGDPPPDAVVALRREIADAAALLVCTPEYAGALPGSFKNLLDWTVGGVETRDKPTGWVNVSPSATRAANAHASLRLVLGYTEARLVEDACVHLPVRPDMISDGVVVDAGVRDGLVGALAALTAAVGDRPRDGPGR